MCLIVDANRASLVFQFPVPAEFQPLWRWLDGPHGRLVYGGKLAAELLKVRAAAVRLAEMRRTGRAHLEPEGAVTREEDTLAGMCRSDDPHVLALARVSGARILCTEDLRLMDDFKDTTIVPRPAGKIYRHRAHSRLFDGPRYGHCRGCSGK